LQFSFGENEAMKNEIHVDRFTVLTAILFTALLSACNLDTWAKRCSVAGNEWTTAIHETGDGGFILADSSDALGSCLRIVAGHEGLFKKTHPKPWQAVDGMRHS